MQNMNPLKSSIMLGEEDDDDNIYGFVMGTTGSAAVMMGHIEESRNNLGHTKQLTGLINPVNNTTSDTFTDCEEDCN